MKRLLALLLALGIPALALGQVSAPQVPITGNIGSGGAFPLLNSGTLLFTSDANRTMAYPEMSAAFLKVISTVSLTATRNLIAPITIGYFFTIENATTGGQSIQVVGSSGTGVTIANGATTTVYCDGTNYVSAPVPSGGVSQIIAGTNVTVSPAGGTGAVTITAASSGGGLGGALSSSNLSYGSAWGSLSGAGYTSIAGLDGNHQITLSFNGQSLYTGALLTVTFTASRGHTSYCVGSVNPGSTGLYVSASSATSYTISNNTAGTVNNPVVISESCP